MRQIQNIIYIGGNIVRHSADLPDSDIQLVFDYLFHKQCYKLFDAGLGVCVRTNYTISPIEPENPDSLWQFESLSDKIHVRIEKTFSIYETLRIASSALSIVLALRMRTADMMPAYSMYFGD